MEHADKLFSCTAVYQASRWRPQSETQARFEVLDRAIKIAIKKFPFRPRNRFGESAQKLQPPELLINFSGFCYFDFDRHILMP